MFLIPYFLVVALIAELRAHSSFPDAVRLHRDLPYNKFFRAWDFYLLDFFDPLLVRLI